MQPLQLQRKKKQSELGMIDDLRFVSYLIACDQVNARACYIEVYRQIYQVYSYKSSQSPPAHAWVRQMIGILNMRDPRGIHNRFLKCAGEFQISDNNKLSEFPIKNSVWGLSLIVLNFSSFFVFLLFCISFVVFIAILYTFHRQLGSRRHAVPAHYSIVMGRLSDRGRAQENWRCWQMPWCDAIWPHYAMGLWMLAVFDTITNLFALLKNAVGFFAWRCLQICKGDWQRQSHRQGKAETGKEKETERERKRLTVEMWQSQPWEVKSKAAEKSNPSAIGQITVSCRLCKTRTGRQPAKWMQNNSRKTNWPTNWQTDSQTDRLTDWLRPKGKSALRAVAANRVFYRKPPTRSGSTSLGQKLSLSISHSLSRVSFDFIVDCNLQLLLLLLWLMFLLLWRWCVLLLTLISAFCCCSVVLPLGGCLLWLCLALFGYLNAS